MFSVCGPVPTLAQSPADFYKGQTVTIILSSAPGGGYDAVARTLAAHLPKHIPGNPTVVVKNMAGAGGIVAANFLYNVAPKDGLTIGGLQNNVPFEPLFGTQEAKFRPDQIHLARHAQPGNRDPHRLAHRPGRQLAAGQDHRTDDGIVRQQFDAEFLRSAVE